MSFSVAVVARPVLEYKAKPPGKRWFVKGKSGAEFFRLTQRWHSVERVIDRARNWYRERITDSETGEVVRECEEALTDHQGRGDAKKPDRR